MAEYKDGQNDRRPKKRKNFPNISGKSNIWQGNISYGWQQFY